LSWIGFSMLRGSSTENKSAPSDNSVKDASLTPLILFAASLGTITGVITIAAIHTRLMFPVTALVAVVVATAVMWLVLVFTILLGTRATSSGFVHDTATRFMGLVVIAMGVQFALTGIRSFFELSRV